MNVCTYDNPQTFARELWQDGECIGHTQATVLMSKGWRGHPNWDFRFNVGPWADGKVYGNAFALIGGDNGDGKHAP